MVPVSRSEKKQQYIYAPKESVEACEACTYLLLQAITTLSIFQLHNLWKSSPDIQKRNQASASVLTVNMSVDEW